MYHSIRKNKKGVPKMIVKNTLKPLSPQQMTQVVGGHGPTMDPTGKP
jgi:hypothetical protein